MNRMNYHALTVALLLSLSISPAQSQTPEQSPETLEKRVEALEKRLNALESIPALATALKMDGQAQSAAAEIPTPKEQKNAPLEVVDWSYSFRNSQYDFEKAHLISYTLKNRTDKAIKLVQGSIVFRDLLDEKILQIRLLPDVLYPPKGSKDAKGAWKVNMFDTEQERMQTARHDDIKPELVIDKAVFEDNSIWSAEGHNP